MKRYIGYVEEIDWETNTCKLRIPNVDGLDTLAYVDPTIAILRRLRTDKSNLQNADIPYHMQGLRLNDIVYCLDSESENDNYTIVGFYGGTNKKQEE